MKIQIRNGRVFEEQGCFTEKTLYILDEKLVTEAEYFKGEGREEIVDANGSYVIPGLTDVHFHGCMGYDCCDGTREAFEAMIDYEVHQGVTTITPATMTMPEEVLLQVARAARETADSKGRVLQGLYMEGPFISMAKKGAQNGAYVHKPDLEMLKRLQEASGNMFRAVVVAPETEGAMEFIKEASRSVTVSLAHTAADYETARQALENGASQMTHLYNGMNGFTHRAPGPIGAAADHESCRAELICDGQHIHPAVVRTTFRMFGDDRMILISDSMRAAGMPDGDYELGGQKVIVKGTQAVLEDGTLAGSVTNLMDCVRTAVKKMGIPLGSAVKAAAVNSAKAVHIFDEFGSLVPGKYANVVLLNENLDTEQVYLCGQRIVG